MLLAPVFLPRLRDLPAAARPAGFFLLAAENNAASQNFCHTFQLIRASDYTSRIAALGAQSSRHSRPARPASEQCQVHSSTF